MKISKTAISFIVLIVWAVFSIGWMCFDNWQDFKNQQLNAAYQQGMAGAVQSIITESEKCAQTGVPLNVGDKKATIVNVTCLQAPAADKASAAAPATPTAPKK